MRRLALAARQGIQANLIRTLGFFRKELFSVFRQPRLLLTLIVGPFLILLIFGLGYRQTPPPFRTLLVVGSEQAQLVADRQDLNEAFGNAIDLRGTSTDAVAARQQLADGDLDLVILAPEDPTSALESGERATFTVVHGEVDPVIRANISLVARLSVDEINRRVLADVVDVAQAESGPEEASLGGGQSRPGPPQPPFAGSVAPGARAPSAKAVARKAAPWRRLSGSIA
jgi:ABC-2 type transport system permease protein